MLVVLRLVWPTGPVVGQGELATLKLQRVLLGKPERDFWTRICFLGCFHTAYVVTI